MSGPISSLFSLCVQHTRWAVFRGGEAGRTGPAFLPVGTGQTVPARHERPRLRLGGGGSEVPVLLIRCWKSLRDKSPLPLPPTPTRCRHTPAPATTRYRARTGLRVAQSLNLVLGLCVCGGEGGGGQAGAGLGVEGGPGRGVGGTARGRRHDTALSGGAV